MVIVSWNCNGALRTKLHAIETLAADILVIQECEDPAAAKASAYRAWASNYLWVGTNKNKGLGVFAKPGIKLTAVDLDAAELQTFLPCRINDRILLLAVWTRQADSPTFRFVGQLWKYLQRHREALRGDSKIILGDFNSNVCWDRPDRWWNHSDVVKILGWDGLLSLYHHSRCVMQGLELEHTFFMQRNPNKPYHIDYAFIPERWLEESSLNIGAPSDWLAHSDHMPLKIQLPRAVSMADSTCDHDEL
jgi:exonuclease III